jgi:transcriptional regulator with XRE-family HTH domain
MPSTTGSEFGDLLRKLRNDSGLTQEGLAEKAGLSPRSVSDLERGVNKTARHDTARLLATALGFQGAARAEFAAVAAGRTPQRLRRAVRHAVHPNATPRHRRLHRLVITCAGSPWTAC